MAYDLLLTNRIMGKVTGKCLRIQCPLAETLIPGSEEDRASSHACMSAQSGRKKTYCCKREWQHRNKYN